MGGTELPWMGAGRILVPSGAAGATSLITRQGIGTGGLWTWAPVCHRHGQGEA